MAMSRKSSAPTSQTTAARMNLTSQREDQSAGTDQVAHPGRASTYCAGLKRTPSRDVALDTMTITTVKPIADAPTARNTMPRVRIVTMRSGTSAPRSARRLAPTASGTCAVRER